ncbi:GGDEF domain-containing protein [Anaerostipes sp.]|uniref:GGDEF domain-containing protein n=1 Tax=Anaerostipes sp. TaxID=1872530 RepID=UPI0025C1D7FD|nr:GGDEF domain-containing protein [Anaerostipes sp.]MBS7007273.1 GGDEF domain-containing protein [Anaerostipes sp.]
MFDDLFSITFPGFLSVRDANQRIIHLNQNFRDWIAAYTDVEPLGKTNIELARLVPKEVADTFLQCHDGSIALQNMDGPSRFGSGLKKIIDFKSPDGKPEHTSYYDVTKYSVVIDENYYIFTISYDITELYLENQLNQFYSTVDPLTGAYNRRYLSRHMQFVKGNPVVLIDLDNFKMVNDYEGHYVGDRILKDFAAFLKDNLPGLMCIIRLGGDEFLLVFSEGTGKDQLTGLMKHVRRRYEENYSQYKYLSFSFGLATATDHLGETISLLDEAMYADKARKRRRNT